MARWSGSRRARNAELLHAKLQGGALDAQAGGGVAEVEAAGLVGEVEFVVDGSPASGIVIRLRNAAKKALNRYENLVPGAGLEPALPLREKGF